METTSRQQTDVWRVWAVQMAGGQTGGRPAQMAVQCIVWHDAKSLEPLQPRCLKLHTCCAVELFCANQSAKRHSGIIFNGSRALICRGCSALPVSHARRRMTGTGSVYQSDDGRICQLLVNTWTSERQFRCRLAFFWLQKHTWGGGVVICGQAVVGVVAGFPSILHGVNRNFISAYAA
jgi:hypothetical protein